MSRTSARSRHQRHMSESAGTPVALILTPFCTVPRIDKPRPGRHIGSGAAREPAVSYGALAELRPTWSCQFGIRKGRRVTLLTAPNETSSRYLVMTEVATAANQFSPPGRPA